MADLICRSCREPVHPGDLICPGCRANLSVADSVLQSADLAVESEPTALLDPGGGSAYLGTAGESECAEPAGDPSAPCPTCGDELPGTDPPVCPGCLTPLTGALVLRFEPTDRQGDRWRQVVLPGTSLVLGRDPRHSPAAAILASYDTVSRQHARVTVDQGRRGTVTDLQSLNGTFVDDLPVRTGAVAELRPGARLRLGSTVSFLVEQT